MALLADDMLPERPVVPARKSPLDMAGAPRCVYRRMADRWAGGPREEVRVHVEAGTVILLGDHVHLIDGERAVAGDDPGAVPDNYLGIAEGTSPVGSEGPLPVATRGFYWIPSFTIKPPIRQNHWVEPVGAIWVMSANRIESAIGKIINYEIHEEAPDGEIGLLVELGRPGAAHLYRGGNRIMGTELTLQDEIREVRSLLTSDAVKSQIALALPKHLTPDRMLRVAITSIQKTPQLVECDRKSLIGAIVQCSQLGLEPDGVLGHAYLVPFKGQVQLIPGYKGLIELARRSGRINAIHAEVVYQADEFEVTYGLNPDLQHRPVFAGDRGPITGAYAVARFKDGSTQFAYMSSVEIDQIRDGSPSARGKSSPWQTHYPEMAKKTAVRRLCKMLPQSPEIARAVQLDEAYQAGGDQGLAGFIDVPSGPALEAPKPEPVPETPPEPTDEQKTDSHRRMTEYLEMLDQAQSVGDVKSLRDAAGDDEVMLDGHRGAFWAACDERIEGIKAGRGERSNAQ